MRTHQGPLMQSEVMEFKHEILVAIYMACKANEMRKVISPSGSSYCVSYDNNTLVISSKTETYDLDARVLLSPVIPKRGSQYFIWYGSISISISYD